MLVFLTRSRPFVPTILNSITYKCSCRRLRVCVHVYMYVFVRGCLLRVDTRICPSVCLSVLPSIFLSFYLSVRLSFCPSIFLSVLLSFCLSICLSVYLSASRSVCPIATRKLNYIWTARLAEEKAAKWKNARNRRMKKRRRWRGSVDNGGRGIGGSSERNGRRKRTGRETSWWKGMWN